MKAFLIILLWVGLAGCIIAPFAACVRCPNLKSCAHCYFRNAPCKKR